MANTEEKIEDGFAIYKGSPLPSFQRPLVLIAWQVHPPQSGEGEFRRAQYFIVVPTRDVVAKQMEASQDQLDALHLPNVLNVEAMKRCALHQAQLWLDNLAKEQLSLSQPASLLVQTVTLAEAQMEDLAALALADEYAEAWDFIRSRTYGPALKSWLGKVLKLRNGEYDFNDAPVFRPQLRRAGRQT